MISDELLVTLIAAVAGIIAAIIGRVSTSGKQWFLWCLIGIILGGGGTTIYIIYIQKPDLENISLHKPISASSIYKDLAAPNAVDGNDSTYWNSGGDPEQWVQIDLTSERDIYGLKLIVEQDPAGDTIHEIYCRSDKIKQWTHLFKFESNTKAGQKLCCEFRKPIKDQRYVKVVTKKNPGWVGWREIKILSNK